MRLKVINHLQLVFEIAEKQVCLSQRLVLSGLQVAQGRKLCKCTNRAALLQLRLPATVDQLQSLHKELDLANAPCTEFDVLFVALSGRQFGFNATLDLLNLVQGCKVEKLSINKGIECPGKIPRPVPPIRRRVEP